jgi:hypothetical protein
MHEFNDSTLWPSSDFESSLKTTGTSGYARLGGPALLPMELLADLGRLAADPARNDVLEVVAACLRHGHASLLCVSLGAVVCPVTLFPAQQTFHSPRDLGALPDVEFASWRVLAAEPPGVPMPDQVTGAVGLHIDHYRPLAPLLWKLALHGPRRRLLQEIGGTAAYRVLRDPSADGLPLSGAVQSSLQRLRRDAASVRAISEWPGMSVERACRLLNALYLASALLVTRTHPAARDEPAAVMLLRSSKSAGGVREGC